MKDKNGIGICCENCDVNAQIDCANWNTENCEEGSEHCVNEYFLPSYEACEARISELQSKLMVARESGDVEAQDIDMLRADVKELRAENERLMDFLMEHCILHPDVKKGMDRLNALADKREGLKFKCEVLEEQAFTIEQLDLIRNIFRVFVDENERMDGDDKSDSLTIIAKCDAILKGVEK